ncbi:MAG: hypothetical protein PVJ07_01970 [Anaerolineales bacterium]
MDEGRLAVGPAVGDADSDAKEGEQAIKPTASNRPTQVEIAALIMCPDILALPLGIEEPLLSVRIFGECSWVWLVDLRIAG